MMIWPGESWLRPEGFGVCVASSFRRSTRLPGKGTYTTRKRWIISEHHFTGYVLLGETRLRGALGDGKGTNPMTGQY